MRTPRGLTGLATAWLVMVAGLAVADDPPTSPPHAPPPATEPSPATAPVPEPTPEATPTTDAPKPREPSATPTTKTPEPTKETEFQEEHVDETETQLTLLDGRVVTGVLIRQDDDAIYLRIVGIPTAFRRQDIAATQVLPSVSSRYKEMRAAIADSDVDRLVLLAEWLRGNGRFDDAIKEIDKALESEPNHRTANELRVLIASQRDLAAKAKAAALARQNEPADSKGPGRRRPEHAPFPLLSSEDVNLIRVYEVDLKDPPRMVIERDVVEELLSKHAGGVLEAIKARYPSTDLMRLIARKGGDVEAFRDRDVINAVASMSPVQLLEIMFDPRVRARDLYGRVKVLEDPAAMKIFRDSVQNSWLVNSCATYACHGGEEAGRLWLTPKNPYSDVSTYTNFLILSRYTLEDGTPLIDVQKPGASPLLQMGMLRKKSKYPHPQVLRGPAKTEAWRSLFTDPNDRRFKHAVEWITGLYKPRPEYPLNYATPMPAKVKARQELKTNTSDPGR